MFRHTLINSDHTCLTLCYVQGLRRKNSPNFPFSMLENATKGMFYDWPVTQDIFKKKKKKNSQRNVDR